jgi:hypothetical protein
VPGRQGERVSFDETEAKQAAEALLVKIQAAQKAGVWKGPVAPHWNVMEPCYGSAAYGAGHWEAYNAYFEKREAGIEMRAAGPRLAIGRSG